MKANMTFQVELPDRYTVDTDHGEIRSYLRQMFNARDYGEIHAIEIVEPEEPAAEPEELPGRLVSFEEAREWMEQDDSNKIIIRNYTPTMVQKLLDSVEALDELEMELGALENMNIEFYIVPAAEPEEPAAEPMD
eukprot:SAG11_NODE_4958_length_1710_cov_320.311608_3_plen_135_part_00